MYKQALITVFDKSGLAEFLKPLAQQGTRLVSTGGTARFLREKGFQVQNVEDLTGFPEVLSGRVKTLHPYVHIPLLARLWVEKDREVLKKHRLKPFDLVIGGLYPFEQKKDSCKNDKELAEWIDIGGPTLLRAAAKNWFHITTVCHPEDYPFVQNGTTLQKRQFLAAKVFKSLARYNHLIANSLENLSLRQENEITSAQTHLQNPDLFKKTKGNQKTQESIKNHKETLKKTRAKMPVEQNNSCYKKSNNEEKTQDTIENKSPLKGVEKQPTFDKKQDFLKQKPPLHDKSLSSGEDFFSLSNQALPLQTHRFKKLRYGENPHQSAEWHSTSKSGLHQALILQGKELSYNNILDLHSAVTAILDFDGPAAVFVKHNNPCGVALADRLETAVEKALKSDPLSVFGAVAAFNQPVNEPSALLLKEVFIEALIAPDITNSALQVLKNKKNLRILKWQDMINFKEPVYSFQEIMGGVLIQTRDKGLREDTQNWQFFGPSPPPSIVRDLVFSQIVCRHLKSNATAIVSNLQTLGLGMGQVSRVSAVESAISRWRQFHPSQKQNLVLAGDGFFPFADSIDLAGRAGISWIVQPGGSIKDKEVLNTAKKWGIRMILTGKRLFKH